MEVEGLRGFSLLIMDFRQLYVWGLGLRYGLLQGVPGFEVRGITLTTYTLRVTLTIATRVTRRVTVRVWESGPFRF